MLEKMVLGTSGQILSRESSPAPKGVHLITGAAGTGKTHKLLDLVKKWLEKYPLQEHQRILFITRLHGSRRRLNERILKECPDLPRKVTTVDAFTLQLLNRWRKSFGFERSIVPGEEGDRFHPDCLGIRADFEAIQAKATELLSTNTVSSLFQSMFPLTVIDEFQDCIGKQLEFVKMLRGHTFLLLAADSFQELDGNEEAVAWVEEIAKVKEASIEELGTNLKDNRRTKCKEILHAAYAIRERRPIGDVSRLLIAKPRFPLAVWETINCEKLCREIVVIALVGQTLKTYIQNHYCPVKLF